MLIGGEFGNTKQLLGRVAIAEFEGIPENPTYSPPSESNSIPLKQTTAIDTLFLYQSVPSEPTEIPGLSCCIGAL